MSEPAVADPPEEHEPPSRGRWRLPSDREVEWLAAGLLLLAALVVRVLGLGTVEPNVTAVEVSHLAQMEALALERGPGLFAITPVGASGLALTLPVLLVPIVGDPDLALRVFVAVASVATLGVFYVVCRHAASPLAALGATALLGFSSWFLYFSRNGEFNVMVALLGLGSLWAIQRGLSGAGPGVWALGGALAGLAWYCHPGAVFLVPGLLIHLAAWALRCRGRRRSILVGGAVFAVALAAVALPRAPALFDNVGAAWTALDERVVTVGSPSPVPVSSTLQQTVRSFLLLDTGVAGNARYLASGRAPFDALSGTLLLLSVLLVGRRPLAELPWFGLFLATLVTSQAASPLVPDLGRALAALPAAYLLIGRSLGWLLVHLPFRPVVQAAVIVGIPLIAWTGWQGYAGWMASPLALQARQPGLEYDELDAWRAAQREALLRDEVPVGARAWREQNPRLSTAGRGPRRPREGTGTGTTLGPMDMQQTAAIQAGRGPMAPRGVAATPDGNIVVADETGRVSRVNGEQGSATGLPSAASIRGAQAWDLAADAEGSFYVADAERSLILKLDERGAPVATLGADWGMYRPRGLAVGADGNLYVADTGRNRVVVATTDGKLERTIGPRTGAGELEQPTDVAVDQSGRIYVALPELGRVFVLDPEGQALGGWAIARGDTIESPRLDVVGDGVVAVTEPPDRRVRIVDADGRELGATTFEGGRPFGVATVDGRLAASDPSTGRILIYDLRPR